MMLKVCGLKYRINIEEVLSTSPDFIGHIFYQKSPRYIGNLDADFVKRVSGAKKVGVFVNASVKKIMETKETYGLDFVQLHGEESLEMVRKLFEASVNIIKVFRISDSLPDNLDSFAPYAGYFLFDTQTNSYGGSGKQFDWNVLWEVTHPFFISGGVDLEDVEIIKNMELDNLVGIDVNSRFEESLGFKDVEKIKKLKSLL